MSKFKDAARQMGATSFVRMPIPDRITSLLTDLERLTQRLKSFSGSRYDELENGFNNRRVWALRLLVSTLLFYGLGPSTVQTLY